MPKTSNAVTRVELYEAVYQKVGLSRTESSAFVELVLKEITDCLEKGETVKLSSFGSFMVRKKSQRVGRNPKTGIEVPISPRRVVVFKPSAIMKQQINSPPPGSSAVAVAETVRCGPPAARVGEGG
jgi:integration host factor subunit alpha